LTLRNIPFENQVAIPLTYKGVDLQCGFRLDLLVEDTVILEIKSIEQALPVHEAQLLTYMKAANKRLGFIMNFNVAVLKQGISRRVL
jgi:GxxExxY protein